ncbi:hypothetical protein HD554DRAFT_878366 [Boletus coccyginus]|nr:hypothetical protein HD554DRAFT_878366 [Boletus coccyginus]
MPVVVLPMPARRGCHRRRRGVAYHYRGDSVIVPVVTVLPIPLRCYGGGIVDAIAGSSTYVAVVVLLVPSQRSCRRRRRHRCVGGGRIVVTVVSLMPLQRYGGGIAGATASPMPPSWWSRRQVRWGGHVGGCEWASGGRARLRGRARWGVRGRVRARGEGGGKGPVGGRECQHESCLLMLTQ